MDKKLFIAAIAKFAAGFILVGLLLFVPAGTLGWWQGWLFMGILFVPMFIAGFVMMAKAPDLLRKRLSADEDESEQKTVQALSALMFIAAFVVAGLGFRFGWISLPDWASWAGAVVFLGHVHGVVLAEQAHGLTALMDDLEEVVVGDEIGRRRGDVGAARGLEAREGDRVRADQQAASYHAAGDRICRKIQCRKVFPY